MLSKLLVAAFVGVVAAEHEPGKVHVLTTDNFADYIKTHDAGALVEFYAPWCGHCKKLEPEFDKAAETLHADGVKIPLAKVDATVETKLAQDYEVQGYPTLKWFVGGSATEYDGPRVADGIVQWIKTMTSPAVKEEEPKGDDAIFVTLTGPKEVPDYYSATANKNRKKASWYFVKGDGSSTKLVLQHKGEDAIEAKDVSDQEGLEKFFKDNKYALFGGLDGDTFSSYIERGNGLIWVLLKMTKDTVKDVVAKERAMYTELAKELGSDKYSLTWTNTDEFGKVLESMFGVTEFPKIVVQKKAGDKKSFIYDGPFDKESIKKYVADIESGAIKPHLKSDPEPADQSAEPVKVLVGSTMEKELFQKDKDVLFEVYAPWCGHCKKLDPEYLKVGKKILKEKVDDMIMLAKMDGTSNDSPLEEVSWSGFPSMFYVKAGSSPADIVKYDGGRDAKGIWKWIKKNHSAADKLKEKLAKNKEEKKGDKKEEL